MQRLSTGQWVAWACNWVTIGPKLSWEDSMET